MAGVQVGPFEVGQIKAHVSHGLEATAIAPLAFRENGDQMTKGGVHLVMANSPLVIGYRGTKTCFSVLYGYYV